METSGGLRAAAALRKSLNDAGCSVVSLVEAKRSALAAYLIHSITPKVWNTLDDLYEYFLIDVDAGGCSTTSPVVAATMSAQLYVYRAIMHLEQDGLPATDPNHIVLRLPAGDSDAEKAKTRARLQEIRKRLLEDPKADFAEMAKLHSQDPQASKAWQLSRARSLIEPTGGEIVAEFFDIGQSRSLPWKRRPEALRLLDTIQNAGRDKEMWMTGAGGSKAVMEQIKKCGLWRATFLYNPAMSADAVYLASLLGAGKGLPGFAAPDIPSKIILSATTVTKDNVDQYESLGF